MIRMSDSDIFFDVIKQIKCQQVNYHSECSIPAFFTNNVDPEKWSVTKVVQCTMYVVTILHNVTPIYLGPE